jgi:hypothetical protein
MSKSMLRLLGIALVAVSITTLLYTQSYVADAPQSGAPSLPSPSLRAAGVARASRVGGGATTPAVAAQIQTQSRDHLPLSAYNCTHNGLLQRIEHWPLYPPHDLSLSVCTYRNLVALDGVVYYVVDEHAHDAATHRAAHGGHAHNNDTQHNDASSTAPASGGDSDTDDEDEHLEGDKGSSALARQRERGFRIPAIRAGVDRLTEQHLWRPTVVARAVLLQRLAAAQTPVRSLERALLWYRLNPGNLYHHLFEDMAPLWRLACRAFGACLKPTDAHVIFLDDRDTWNDSKLEFFSFWRWLTTEYPPTRVGDYKAGGSRDSTKGTAGVALLLKTAWAGSECVCSHPYHCLTPFEDGYMYAFRNELLRRMGVVERKLPLFPLRVLFVQRRRARRILNMDALVDGFKQVGFDARQAMFEDLTSAEQASLFANHHIIVAVHGGVLGNLLFARHNALYIDVRPAQFDHPLLGSIIKAVPELHACAVPLPIGPFDVRTMYKNFTFEDVVWQRISDAERHRFIHERVCPPEPRKVRIWCESQWLFQWVDIWLNATRLTRTLRQYSRILTDQSDGKQNDGDANSGAVSTASQSCPT